MAKYYKDKGELLNAVEKEMAKIERPRVIICDSRDVNYDKDMHRKARFIGDVTHEK